MTRIRSFLRSVIRKRTDEDPNLRADDAAWLREQLEERNVGKEFVKGSNDSEVPDVPNMDDYVPVFNPDELVGKTFLWKGEADDLTYRAKVVAQLNDKDAQDHQRIKYRIKVGDSEVEELMSYVELAYILDEQMKEEINDPERLWIYKAILDHEGPLSSDHPRHQGSAYNVKVQWEDGSTTWEPIATLRSDDPVTLAEYARDHDLLDTPGWKTLKRLVRNSKMFERALKQSKMRSERRAPIYQFGVQVPRDKWEARKLDQQNGNTKWQDAEKKELAQLDHYKTFKSIGHRAPPPPDYQKIRVHFVYAVKHDLRHKARLVAGGHMTPDSGSEAYSSVVQLRSLRIAITIGELNGLKLGVGDVSCAYLEAYTREKVYFVAGPEFGELEGHTMIIVKALYGLRTSGARFHDKFAETLSAMGFIPCAADQDVWMRDAGDCYEYICVYVDDLLAIMKDPTKFFNDLTEKHNYDLKGVGDPDYHLGASFTRDKDGTLALDATRYVKKLVESFKKMFGEDPPKQGVSCPIEPKSHPELDESPLLGAEGVKQYQSIIGALLWAVTLGRFDIFIAVTALSSFRVAPREGHLGMAKRVVGFLAKNPSSAIRFRVGEPPLEMMFRDKIPETNWMGSVYGNAKEELWKGLPEPKGKSVETTHWVDADLMSCKVTGRSTTGILHFINQTPVAWFSKRQATVETATYGSEFVAARQCTDQIEDIRFTLRAMGVPLAGPAWMLGDNHSVITQSTIPQSF